MQRTSFNRVPPETSFLYINMFWWPWMLLSFILTERSAVCVLGLCPPLPQAAFWSSFSSHSDCDRIHSPASPAPETCCQILHHQQKWAGQSCLLPVFCHNLCFLQINSGFMIPDYTEHFACNKQEYIEDFSVELGGESLGWGTMRSSKEELPAGMSFQPLCSSCSAEPCRDGALLHFWERHRAQGFRSRDSGCAIRAGEGCKVNRNQVGIVWGLWQHEVRITKSREQGCSWWNCEGFKAAGFRNYSCAVSSKSVSSHLLMNGSSCSSFESLNVAFPQYWDRTCAWNMVFQCHHYTVFSEEKQNSKPQLDPEISQTT